MTLSTENISPMSTEWMPEKHVNSTKLSAYKDAVEAANLHQQQLKDGTLEYETFQLGGMFLS